MKSFKINQSELNTILLLGLGIAFLLASFSYFHKIKKTEGFAGSSDWVLTTDDGDIALKHKKKNAFIVDKDGYITNSTINDLEEKVEELEKKCQIAATTPGFTGSWKTGAPSPITLTGPSAPDGTGTQGATPAEEIAAK